MDIADLRELEGGAWRGELSAGRRETAPACAICDKALTA